MSEVWLGHKQHFVCAKDCFFALATYLPEKHVIVSTIGEYYYNNEKQDIGFGRHYETMVFKTSENILKCGCPEISDYIEIDLQGYNTAQEAQNGHMEMIKKWKL